MATWGPIQLRLKGSRQVEFDGEASPAPGGGSMPGAPVVRGPFVFTFDMPNLTDGVEFYVPTPGDMLIDAWVVVDEAWAPTGGKTAFADICSTSVPNPGGGGLFIGVGNVQPDLTQADSDYNNSDLLGNYSNANVSLADAQIPTGAGGGVPYRQVPGLFLNATPWIVYVSNQDRGGIDPEASQGSARLYIVTATPSAFS